MIDLSTATIDEENQFLDRLESKIRRSSTSTSDAEDISEQMDVCIHSIKYWNSFHDKLNNLLSCTVKPVLSDHIKQDIFLTFQTGGWLMLHCINICQISRRIFELSA